MTMDATPDHLDDERLSGLLDGDAAEPDVAAHLQACDRCTGRQAELARARAALATVPVEPLDEVTRRRLLTAALDAVGPVPAARRRWAQRHPALVGSAAAAILAVLVGIPFVAGHGGGGTKQSLSAAAPQAAPSEPGAYLGDLGDLGDRDQLRLRLSGAAGSVAARNAAPAAAGGATAAPAAPAASPSAAGVPPSTTPNAPGGSGGSGATKSAGSTAADSAAPYSTEAQLASDPDRADTDRCVAALLDGPARGGRLTRSGVGTWQGRPAVVAAFELSGGTVAFVTDRAGCAVLDRFTY